MENELFETQQEFYKRLLEAQVLLNHFNNFVDTRKQTRYHMDQLKGLVEDIMVFQESYPNAPNIDGKLDPIEKDYFMQSCDKCLER